MIEIIASIVGILITIIITNRWVEKENYPKEICNEFFSINRKCRDNIHYGFYYELTDEELNILIKYQDLYLNYIIYEFEKHLIIKFGAGYKIGLALARLQYWASN